MYHRFCNIVPWVLVMALIHDEAFAQTPIPLEEAIAAIEATEIRVQSYAWKFHFTRNKLKDPNDPATIVETPPDYIDGFFIYDVADGRYLLEFERVSAWGDGAAPYIAMREGWSFDGYEYRHWEQSRHGTELPPLDQAEIDPRDLTIGPLEGKASSTQDAQGEFSAYAIGSGLVYLPPYGFLWLDEDLRILWPLSDVLRKRTDAGEEIAVTELPDGTWQIEMPNSDIEGGRSLVVVDPARGFVVTGAEHSDTQAVYRRLATTIEQVADGVWIPVDIIDYNVIDGSTDRIVLSDIEVNPELADEDFRVLFPIGTQVHDQ